jgi:RHS repeat-associated protein
METGSGGIINNVSSADCDCLEVINPGEPMEQVYAYDGNRNLKSIRGTYTPWYNQDFSYDALNHLTAANGLYGTIDYTYDKVGNRLTRKLKSQTESYTYHPGTNQLARVKGPGDPIDYSYDANGNVTAIGNKILIYNQNNRLIRVEEQGSILGEYVYNGLGQRVIKKVNAESTLFHYDFNGNLIAESQADGIFTSEYLYIDQARLAMVDVAGNTMYYYLNNYLGTPVMMTDDQGFIVWEADYKPFGEAYINPNSEVINNFRFAGQYYDAETELHYNYHRYYYPKTGRYLTTDPIGLAGGINLYAYANLNPMNLIDPFGLREWTIHRYGASVSAVIISLSGQRVQFISNCSAWGGPDSTYQSTGYFGDIKVFTEEPDPITGISVSGPSAGIIMYGGTLAYASLDFSSYAEVYGATSGTSLGLSIFNFEGQGYIPLGTETESCCE